VDLSSLLIDLDIGRLGEGEARLLIETSQLRREVGACLDAGATPGNSGGAGSLV
jgi:hypothetical protein